MLHNRCDLAQKCFDGQLKTDADREAAQKMRLSDPAKYKAKLCSLILPDGVRRKSTDTAKARTVIERMRTFANAFKETRGKLLTQEKYKEALVQSGRAQDMDVAEEMWQACE